jgi:hypothetical protein
MTVETVEFPIGFDLSAFDDWDEYGMRSICSALAAPSWIIRGYQTRDDYELAELSYWIKKITPLPG